ncbi:MAG: hypothetical protein OXC26_13175 [Albidovulum sp.]|nr:hypothetical protein [Albidovulum sp.]
MTWDQIPLGATGAEFNRFSVANIEDGEKLVGAFFGDNGAEVGGVFRSPELPGAFGARRGGEGQMADGDSTDDSA